MSTKEYAGDLIYERKLEEMSKYVPFLEELIEETKKDKDREDQLTKIKALHSLITKNTKRKLNINNLIKCEGILIKLKDKFKHIKSSSNKSDSLKLVSGKNRDLNSPLMKEKLKTKSDVQDFDMAPASPQNADKIADSVVKPIVIPTERQVSPPNVLKTPGNKESAVKFHQNNSIEINRSRENDVEELFQRRSLEKNNASNEELYADSRREKPGKYQSFSEFLVQRAKEKEHRKSPCFGKTVCRDPEKKGDNCIFTLFPSAKNFLKQGGNVTEPVERSRNEKNSTFSSQNTPTISEVLKSPPLSDNDIDSLVNESNCNEGESGCDVAELEMVRRKLLNQIDKQKEGSRKENQTSIMKNCNVEQFSHQPSTPQLKADPNVRLAYKYNPHPRRNSETKTSDLENVQASSSIQHNIQRPSDPRLNRKIAPNTMLRQDPRLKNRNISSMSPRTEWENSITSPLPIGNGSQRENEKNLERTLVPPVSTYATANDPRQLKNSNDIQNSLTKDVNPLSAPMPFIDPRYSSNLSRSVYTSTSFQQKDTIPHKHPIISGSERFQHTNTSNNYHRTVSNVFPNFPPKTSSSYSRDSSEDTNLYRRFHPLINDHVERMKYMASKKNKPEAAKTYGEYRHAKYLERKMNEGLEEGNENWDTKDKEIPSTCSDTVKSSCLDTLYTKMDYSKDLHVTNFKIPKKISEETVDVKIANKDNKKLESKTTVESMSKEESRTKKNSETDGTIDRLEKQSKNLQKVAFENIKITEQINNLSVTEPNESKTDRGKEINEGKPCVLNEDRENGNKPIKSKQGKKEDQDKNNSKDYDKNLENSAFDESCDDDMESVLKKGLDCSQKGLQNMSKARRGHWFDIPETTSDGCEISYQNILMEKRRSKPVMKLDTSGSPNSPRKKHCVSNLDNEEMNTTPEDPSDTRNVNEDDESKKKLITKNKGRNKKFSNDKEDVIQSGDHHETEVSADEDNDNEHNTNTCEGNYRLKLKKNAHYDHQICDVSSTTSCTKKRNFEENAENQKDSEKEDVSKEWLENVLTNMLNADLINKTNVLNMLEKVLDEKKILQIKKIFEEKDEDDKEKPNSVGATEGRKDKTNCLNSGNTSETKDESSKSEDKFENSESSIIENEEEKEKSSEIKQPPDLQNKQKKKTELDRLNEDIRDMFICEGVLTATGKRMCTMIKEQKKEEENVSISASQVQKKVIRKKKSKIIKEEEGDNNKIERMGKNVPVKRRRVKPACLKPVKLTDSLSAKGIDSSDIRMPTLEPYISTESEEGTHNDSFISIKYENKKLKKKQKPCPKSKRKYQYSSSDTDDDCDEETIPVLSSVHENNKTINSTLSIEESRTDSSIILSEGDNQNTESALSAFKNISPSMHSQSRHSQKCTYCNYSGQYLIQHYLSVHPNSEILISRLPPSILEKMRRNLENYPHKIRKRAKEIIYEYKCPFCSNEYKRNKKSWINHFSGHTGEYRYKCSECNKCRNEKRDLLKHISKSCPKAKVIQLKPQFKHDKTVTTVDVYICSLCNYIQFSKSNILQHLKIQHETQKDKLKKITLMHCFKKEKTIKVHKDNQTDILENDQLEVSILDENSSSNLDPHFIRYMNEISFSRELNEIEEKPASTSIVDRLRQKLSGSQSIETIGTNKDETKPERTVGSIGLIDSNSVLTPSVLMTKMKNEKILSAKLKNNEGNKILSKSSDNSVDDTMQDKSVVNNSDEIPKILFIAEIIDDDLAKTGNIEAKAITINSANSEIDLSSFGYSEKRRLQIANKAELQSSAVFDLKEKTEKKNEEQSTKDDVEQLEEKISSSKSTINSSITIKDKSTRSGMLIVERLSKRLQSAESIGNLMSREDADTTREENDEYGEEETMEEEGEDEADSDDDTEISTEDGDQEIEKENKSNENTKEEKVSNEKSVISYVVDAVNVAKDEKTNELKEDTVPSNISTGDLLETNIDPTDEALSHNSKEPEEIQESNGINSFTTGKCPDDKELEKQLTNVEIENEDPRSHELSSSDKGTVHESKVELVSRKKEEDKNDDAVKDLNTTEDLNDDSNWEDIEVVSNEKKNEKSAKVCSLRRIKPKAIYQTLSKLYTRLQPSEKKDKSSKRITKTNSENNKETSSNEVENLKTKRAPPQDDENTTKEKEESEKKCKILYLEIPKKTKDDNNKGDTFKTYSSTQDKLPKHDPQSNITSTLRPDEALNNKSGNLSTTGSLNIQSPINNSIKTNNRGSEKSMTDDISGLLGLSPDINPLDQVDINVFSQQCIVPAELSQIDLNAINSSPELNVHHQNFPINFINIGNSGGKQVQNSLDEETSKSLPRTTFDNELTDGDDNSSNRPNSGLNQNAVLSVHNSDANSTNLPSFKRPLLEKKNSTNKSCTDFSEEARNLTIHRIFNIGYSKIHFSDIRYACLIENCDFLYSNNLEQLEEHIMQNHPNISWYGFCFTCNRLVEENCSMSLDMEINHMVKTHLHDSRVDKLRLPMEGAVNSNSATMFKGLSMDDKDMNGLLQVPSKPLIKIRRFSGDTLSTSKPKSESCTKMQSGTLILNTNIQQKAIASGFRPYSSEDIDIIPVARIPTSSTQSKTSSKEIPTEVYMAAPRSVSNVSLLKSAVKSAVKGNDLQSAVSDNSPIIVNNPSSLTNLKITSVQEGVNPDTLLKVVSRENSKNKVSMLQHSKNKNFTIIKRREKPFLKITEVISLSPNGNTSSPKESNSLNVLPHSSSQPTILKTLLKESTNESNIRTGTIVENQNGNVTLRTMLKTVSKPPPHPKPSIIHISLPSLVPISKPPTHTTTVPAVTPLKILPSNSRPITSIQASASTLNSVTSVPLSNSDIGNILQKMKNTQSKKDNILPMKKDNASTAKNDKIPITGENNIREMSLDGDFIMNLLPILKPWTSPSSRKPENLLNNMLSESCLFSFYKCMGSDCCFYTNNPEKMLAHLDWHVDKRLDSNKTKTPKDMSLLFDYHHWKECCYCSYRAPNNPSLIEHIKHIHLFDIYQCDQCFYRSCTPYNVVVHRSTYHKKKPDKILLCHGEERKLLLEVKNLVANRAKFVKVISCNDCKEPFYTLKRFTKHLYEAHGNHNQYKCAECLSPVSKNLAEKHLLVKHKIGVYECVLCLYATDTIEFIRVHMAHRHPQNLSYACVRLTPNNKVNNTVMENETLENSTVMVNLAEVVPTEELFRCPYTVEEMEEMCPDKDLVTPSMLKPKQPTNVLISSTIVEDAKNNEEPQKEIQTCDPSKEIASSNNTLAENVDTNTTDEVHNKGNKHDESESTIPAKVEEIPTKNGDKDKGNLDERILKAAKTMVENSGISDNELYGCPFPNCGIVLTNSISFGIHLNSHNVGDSNKLLELKCVHCSQTFKTSLSLKTHIKIHALHRYFCYFCTFTSSTVYHVMRHIGDVHSKTPLMTMPLIASLTNKIHDFFVICPKGVVASEITQCGEKIIRSAERKSWLNKKCYSPDELDMLPRQAIFTNEVYCKDCNYRTKVRTNMYRHLQHHKQEVNVTSVDPVNPVPCLKSNEKHFDKMVNLACSAYIDATERNKEKEKLSTEPSSKNKEVSTSSSSTPSATTGSRRSLEVLTPKLESEIPAYIHQSKRYVCGVPGCTYLNISESLLKCHLSALHSTEKTYNCPHCSVELFKKTFCADKIIAHLRFHGMKLFQCDTCSYLHPHKYVVERHISEKHSGTIHIITYERNGTDTKKSIEQFTKGKNNLTTIPVVSSTKTAVSSDEQPKAIPNTSGTSTQKIQNKWECGVCKFRLATYNQMYSHMIRVHKIKDRYQCSHCEFCSPQMAPILSHVGEKHPTKIKEARCLFYKIKESHPESKQLDTTPIWTRDPSKIKSIRGILMEEEEVIPLETEDEEEELENDSCKEEESEAVIASQEVSTRNINSSSTKNSQMEKIENFSCTSCSFYGKTELELKEHTDSCLTNEDTKNITVSLESRFIFFCYHCMYPVSLKNLRAHWHKKHSKEEHWTLDKFLDKQELPCWFKISSLFACGYCNNEYKSTLVNIIKHHALQHDSKPYLVTDASDSSKCTQCSFKDTNLEKLYSHISSENKKFKEKKINLSNELLQKLLKFGYTQKFVMCQRCNEIPFAYKCFNGHHALSHSNKDPQHKIIQGETLYLCSKCIFLSDEETIIRHMYNHDFNCNYKCQTCSKKMDSFPAFAQHLKEAHSMKPNKSTINICMEYKIKFLTEMKVVFPNGLVVEKSQLKDTEYGNLDMIKRIVREEYLDYLIETDKKEESNKNDTKITTKQDGRTSKRKLKEHLKINNQDADVDDENENESPGMSSTKETFKNSIKKQSLSNNSTSLKERNRKRKSNEPEESNENSNTKTRKRIKKDLEVNDQSHCSEEKSIKNNKNNNQENTLEKKLSKPVKPDLSKFYTNMIIGGKEVPISCDRFAKLVKVDAVVRVHKFNINKLRNPDGKFSVKRIKMKAGSTASTALKRKLQKV